MGSPGIPSYDTDNQGSRHNRQIVVSQLKKNERSLQTSLPGIEFSSFSLSPKRNPVKNDFRWHVFYKPQLNHRNYKTLLSVLLFSFFPSKYQAYNTALWVLPKSTWMLQSLIMNMTAKLLGAWIVPSLECSAGIQWIIDSTISPKCFDFAI